MKRILILLALATLWSPVAQCLDCGKDIPVTLQDIKACAELGDAYAQDLLGMIYFKGKEVPRNYKKGFEWTYKSAQQGYKDAQANLGFDYYNGWGVRKNHVLAYMWWSLYAVNEKSPLIDQNLSDLEQELTPDELARAQQMATDWQLKRQLKKQ